MSTMAERAQRRNHYGDAEPWWSLHIGGEDWTKEARTLNYDLDGETGTSSLNIETTGRPLTGYTNAKVELRLGYGRPDIDLLQIPYFVGELVEPASLRLGQGVAYGPLKLMADQSFGKRTIYNSGTSIGEVLTDMARLAGFRSGVMHVKDGNQSRLQKKKVYNEEVLIGEAAQALVKPVGMRLYEIPGNRILATPSPRKGVGGKAKTVYTPAHYPDNGFNVSDTRTTTYSSVVILRRAEDGQDAIRVKVDIDNKGKWKPPKNRIFYITDFAGDEAEAKKQASKEARALQNGEQETELNGIWINPTIQLWDEIDVEAIERGIRPNDYTITTYHTSIKNGISFEITNERFHMGLRGGSVPKKTEKRKRKRKKHEKKRMKSSGLVKKGA